MKLINENVDIRKLAWKYSVTHWTVAQLMRKYGRDIKAIERDLQARGAK